MSLKFFIEQVALCPRDPDAAIALLTAIGLGDWARDHVVANGRVFGDPGTNEADLAFNYQATRGINALPNAGGHVIDFEAGPRPLEVELLHYTDGPNWMTAHVPSVSHLGMHCSAEELQGWRKLLGDRGIEVAQEVFTESHTNPNIAGKRWYNYVIFDTRDILGVDLKFIVRRDTKGHA